MDEIKSKVMNLFRYYIDAFEKMDTRALIKAMDSGGLKGLEVDVITDRGVKIGNRELIAWFDIEYYEPEMGSDVTTTLFLIWNGGKKLGADVLGTLKKK